MNKLNINHWEEFKISDLFLWQKGKTLSKENKEKFKGSIPCINGSAFNNGILTYLDADIKTIGFNLQKAPCLSLSRVGNSGLTFLQEEDFFIADNAYSLTLKNKNFSNSYVYLFLSTILNKELYKYNYGRIINSRYFKTKVLLPAKQKSNKKYEPDWRYMENYIKNLQLQIKFKPIYTKNKNIEKMNMKTWKEFPITSLFNVHGSKTTPKLKLEEYGAGDYPYVTTQATNNGIAGFYDFWTENKNVLTIDSAVAGFCSYQDKEFSASDHVEILEPLQNTILNKYTAMFLKTIISCSKYKYDYGRKFNQNRIRETILLLPAKQKSNKKYEPDWQYMENYIKSLPYADLI